MSSASKLFVVASAVCRYTINLRLGFKSLGCYFLLEKQMIQRYIVEIDSDEILDDDDVIYEITNQIDCYYNVEVKKYPEQILTEN